IPSSSKSAEAIETGCPKLTATGAVAPGSPSAVIALEDVLRMAPAKALTWFTVKPCGSDSQMRGGLGLACWPRAAAHNKRTDNITAHTVLATCRRVETGRLLTTTPLGAHWVYGPTLQSTKAQKSLPGDQGTAWSFSRLQSH